MNQSTTNAPLPSAKKKRQYSPRDDGEAFRIKLNKDDLARVRKLQELLSNATEIKAVPSVAVLIRWAIRRTYRDIRSELIASLSNGR